MFLKKGSGGAVVCNGNLEVRDSMFKRNVAAVDGGALACAKALDAHNSTLTDNWAKGGVCSENP